MFNLFDDFEQFRKAADKSIEELIRFHKHELPVLDLPSSVAPHKAASASGVQIPWEGTDLSTIVDELVKQYLYCAVHQNHPRYVSTIPGPASFVSCLGDLLASGFNSFAGNWSEGAGAVDLERQVISWVAQIMSFPENSGGLLTPSGTLSNLTALVAARSMLIPDAHLSAATLIISKTAHFSFERIARVMGIRSENLVRVQTKRSGEIILDDLADTIRRCSQNGKKVFCVVANAGTTNTAAVDDFAEIRRICDSHGIWMHVDGAFGGAGVLDTRNRSLFEGMSRADSITLDFHKWWFQSYESSALLFSDSAPFASAFTDSADYLDSLKNDRIDPYDLGIQVTRSARSVKAWLTFKALGLEKIVEAVRVCQDNSEKLCALLEATGHWRIITGPQLATFTFCALDQSGELMEKREMESLIQDVERNDKVGIIGTVVNKLPALRVCAINPALNESDISIMVETLESAWRVITES